MESFDSIPLKETLWGQQFIWFWRGNAYGLDDDDDDDDDDWPISLGVNLSHLTKRKAFFTSSFGAWVLPKNTGSMSHRVNMSNITDNGNRMVVDDDLHTYAMVAWVASLAHKDQQRKTGGAYIMHPLGVSCLIDPAWSKLDNMCVAVCHDVLEDVPHMLDYAKEELDKYGFRIAEPEMGLPFSERKTHPLAGCMPQWEHEMGSLYYF